MAALCKSYSAQIEAGNDFLPLGDRNERDPDRSHDRPRAGC